jgi:predicted nucleic acid-binding protein
VTRTSRKYVLDTQLFIHGFRNRAANEALQQFHRVFAPFEYLNVIVAQELRSGVQRPEDRKAAGTACPEYLRARESDDYAVNRRLAPIR